MHWLPSEVVGINGTPPGEQPPLAHWIFSQPFAKHEACRALERGLAGGYGVEWEQPPQSFIFFGNGDFEQIEQCAKALMEGFGGSARMEKQSLILRMDDSESRVQFARRGDQLVFIVDDGKIGPVHEARSDRLKGNGPLVALLAGVDPSKMTWSVSSQDLTLVPLGVPSLGYTMYIGSPGQRFELLFTFADQAEAERAQRAAGPFLKQAESFLGASLHPKIQRDADILTVSLDPMGILALGPTKMQALQKKMQEFVSPNLPKESPSEDPQ